MKHLAVDLISDLHLDRWPDIEMQYIPNPGIDTVIVAGDLHRNPRLAGRELMKIRAAYKTVLFVDGNNEFRDAILTDGNLNIADVEKELRGVIADVNAAYGGGVHYLKDGPFVRDHVAIIGRNGHWDHEADPRISIGEALEQQRARINAVLKLADAPASLSARLEADIREQAAKQRVSPAFASAAQKRTTPVTLDEAAGNRRQALRDFEELRDEIVRLGPERDVTTIVAVTHTVPHIPGTALLDFNNEKWSPLVMSTMANTRMANLGNRDHDPHGKLKYHLFGHQHACKDMIVGGVRYIGNPCGDPGQLYEAGALLNYRPMTVTFAPAHDPAARHAPPAIVKAPGNARG